ncbi:hypothetical protein Slin15195_G026490 [Septoria linicola]|uniref:Uncharacterized protein n=1 Tax=Septoria linicola TaxID=215465 RepID=A0A9Q9AMV2_9PEZI|nr:hypothetical protein Slin14017_G025550 [Septoria linicola]USW49330.1 hypothetical protein Slin15195_G026490 [Septoria linicola]
MLVLVALLAILSVLHSVSALPSAKSATLAAPAPTLDEFLTEVDVETRRNVPRPRHVVKPRHLDTRQANLNASAPAPNATVELCTDPQFGGQCVNSTWPVNTCISLNGYAGAVQSIDPKKGFECLLTQGRCNVALPYISVGSDVSDTAGDDLSALPWIEDSNSYMCFTEIEALRLFVRMRLRAPIREATGVSRLAKVGRGEKVKRELVKMWVWASGVLENLEQEEARVNGSE